MKKEEGDAVSFTGGQVNIQLGSPLVNVFQDNAVDDRW